MSKIKIKNINYQYALDDLFAGKIGKLVRCKQERIFWNDTHIQRTNTKKGWCVEKGTLGIVLDFIPAEKDKYNSYSYPVDTEYYNNDFIWRRGKQSRIAGAIVIEWIGKGLKETIILKPTETFERSNERSYHQPRKLEQYIEPLTK